MIPRTRPDPHRLIEELVYERVRLDADLLALTELEHDLATSFCRVLAETGSTSAELAAVIDLAMERALARVAAELADEADPDDDTECPLCETPLVCPPPDSTRPRPPPLTRPG